MRVANIDFNPAVAASGVMGFFGGDAGTEYWHHHAYKLIPGFTFDGMTFCAKTTPYYARKGNTALAKNRIHIKEMFPDSIHDQLWNNLLLNAVGVPSPGAMFLLAQGYWQARTDPFMLSYMSFCEKLEDKIEETRKYLTLLSLTKSDFRSQFINQMNISCPNTGHDTLETAKQATPLLDVTGEFGFMSLVKINHLTSVEDAKAIEEHPACAGLVCFNTLPFGNIPAHLKERYFPKGSPLAKYGGGGLSGAPIFPMTLEWLRKAEGMGFTKPIIAGGGVTSVRDVEQLAELNCVKAISLGTAAITRPHLMRKLIKTINQHPQFA